MDVATLDLVRAQACDLGAHFDHLVYPYPTSLRPVAPGVYDHACHWHGLRGATFGELAHHLADYFVHVEAVRWARAHAAGPHLGPR